VFGAGKINTGIGQLSSLVLPPFTMTRKQIADNQYYNSAKSQTFYKGDEFYKMMSWLMENVETVSVGEKGCQVVNKCVLSVKILNERSGNYKPKK
jgi:hypothetical protein